MKITEEVLDCALSNAISYHRLLFVDDDPAILEGYQYIFEAEGFKVDLAQDETTLIHLIKKRNYQTIILDYNIGSKKGAELAKEIDEFCDSELIFISGQVGAESELKRMNIKYDGFFLKPLKAEDLLGFIKDHIMDV